MGAETGGPGPHPGPGAGLSIFSGPALHPAGLRRHRTVHRAAHLTHPHRGGGGGGGGLPPGRRGL